jgi:hypothetical protein
MKYQALELILRDSAHVQSFLEIAESQDVAAKSDRQRVNDAVSSRFLSRFGVHRDGGEVNNGKA